jgi:uncharacterized protein (TIGR03067 family)
MIRLRLVRWVAPAALALSSARAQESPAAKQEMDRLRGTFSMLAGMADGVEMPATMTTAMKRVAEGSVTTVTMGTNLYIKANFSVDASAAPKTIDYDMTGGFTAGKKQLGIYRTSGDTVVFCFGSPGSARPTTFESKPGSGVTCSTWKREN